MVRESLKSKDLSQWERSFLQNLNKELGGGATIGKTTAQKLTQIWTKAQPREDTKYACVSCLSEAYKGDVIACGNPNNPSYICKPCYERVRPLRNGITIFEWEPGKWARRDPDGSTFYYGH